jgi:hypothetical protein
MNHVPRVSVLMSVFNAETYLCQAVDSILQQTMGEFEFIIINDASTDHSPDILKQYRDSRLNIINNDKNLGLSSSLNIGLQDVRGEYVARMDADDVAHPERLALQLRFLDAHADYVLVGSSYQLIDDSGTVLEVHRKPMDHTELLWLTHTRTPLEHASVTYRLRPRGQPPLLYKEQYRTAQDLDFWIRLLKFGKGAVLPQLLLSYRTHGENISNTLSSQQVSNMIQIAASAACSTYGLSGREQDQVRELVEFLNVAGTFSLGQFTRVQATLNRLVERFISVHSLPAKEADFIRRRACGQLWNAALIKRSPEAYCLAMMPIAAPRSFLRAARRRIMGEQYWPNALTRTMAEYPLGVT